jgi:hypothetical protein
LVAKVIWLRLFVVMPVAVVGALMQFEIADQQDISMRPTTVALPLNIVLKRGFMAGQTLW